MDRVDSIMEKLGFRKEASDGAKAAFVKNLIKQAYGVEVPLPPQYAGQQQTIEEFSAAIIEGTRDVLSPPAKADAQQLSFDLKDSSETG
jgi:hypothetical protein